MVKVGELNVVTWMNISQICEKYLNEGRSKEEEGRRFHVAVRAARPKLLVLLPSRSLLSAASVRPKPLPSAHERGLYPSVFRFVALSWRNAYSTLRACAARLPRKIFVGNAFLDIFLLPSSFFLPTESVKYNNTFWRHLTILIPKTVLYK